MSHWPGRAVSSAGYRARCRRLHVQRLCWSLLAGTETGAGGAAVGIIDASLQPADGLQDITRTPAAKTAAETCGVVGAGEALAAAGFTTFLEQLVLDMADCDLLLYQASVDGTG